MPLKDLLLIGLIAIVTHEAGHIAAAVVLGIGVKRIGISWKGVYIVRETAGPVPNMLVTLAGPLANLLLAAAWQGSHEFVILNWIFAVSNLLPLKGSDGSRIWAQLTRGTRRNQTAA
jgi:Zn-dependent protease